MQIKVLRQYKRVAQQCHNCWYCQSMIHPGQEYEAEVTVASTANRRGRFQVWKRHVNPGCDLPPEPDGGRRLMSGFIHKAKRVAA